MTLRMYADRKGWPLGEVRVTLRHSRIHAQDCAACETSKGWINHIDCDVELTGDSTKINGNGYCTSRNAARCIRH
jgi:putative redox protein